MTVLESAACPSPAASPARVADLHLHTRYSDGTFSPEELVLHARDEGLSAIALTDHDTVDGCPEAATACRTQGIEFIPGAEITAEIGGQEVHVLGYWLDTNSPLLRERFAVDGRGGVCSGPVQFSGTPASRAGTGAGGLLPGLR